MSLELPPLYIRDAAGKLLKWMVHTEGSHVVIEHGTIKGKMKKIVVPCGATNLGRANQRLPPEQALFEAKSNWDAKIQEGYCESVDEARDRIVYLPALAHPLIQRKTRGGKKIETHREVLYPCSAQRKLNGLRCLAHVQDGAVEFTSRVGIHWQIPHIARDVLTIGRNGDWFDGELYIKGMALQNINSLVKDYRPESEALEYHLYDMPMAEGQADGIWEDRWRTLQERMPKDTSITNAWNIRIVETRIVHTFEEVIAFETLAIDEGYEGLILRKHGHTYAWNVRSDNLIKYKRFQDAEFMVVSATSRTLVDPETRAETEILDCFSCLNNQNDAHFEVVPRGTMKDRKRMWETAADYVGRRLTVRFLERSEDGIPQGNPVGIGFRDEADLAEGGEQSMWGA
jgi:ATP-dependent DNA ligase